MIAAALALTLCGSAPDDAALDDREPTDAEPDDDVAPTTSPRDAPASSNLGDPLPPDRVRNGPSAAAASGPSAAAASETESTDTVPSDAAIAREGRADLGDERKGRRLQRTGSPQRFEVEIKFGPYLPDVDRRYDGPGLGPYATIFGRTDDRGVATAQPRKGVMPAAAFEWQFVYLGGPFGLGAQVAFFRDKARALLAEPMGGENVRSEADDTRFGIVPLSLLLSYRFEYLADRWRWIPIVPYAKAGIGYAFWWTRDGNGDVSVNSMGQKGRGGVLGWQANFGGMLRLDFIEPGTAKKLDQTTGINHTYVFGEYQIARYDNFGVGNSISVGDNTYFLGLAIEF